MLGDLVKQRRRQLGMKQETLAAKVGTGQSAISEIERGLRNNQTREFLERLALALDMPVAELLAASRGELPPAIAQLQGEGAPNEMLTELLNIWDTLSPEDQRTAIDVTRTLAQRAKERQKGEAQGISH